MKITICSLFPDYFTSPLAHSILKRAQNSGKLVIEFLNYRSFATSSDGRVDDRPYGGGPGMVLQPQIVASTLRSIDTAFNPHFIHLSPSGKTLNAQKARQLSKQSHLVLICGHYEGIDQRAIDIFADEEISIGDFVLTSGCPAALLLLDAVARYLPGVLGHPQSTEHESHEEGLLEAPQFTRPAIFEEKEVPAILRSGDHTKIEAWKKEQSLIKTRTSRPDLLDHVSAIKESELSEKDSELSLFAAWEVQNVEKIRHWFVQIWPFSCYWRNEAIIIKMGSCHFKFAPEKDEKFVTESNLKSLKLNLSGSLSQLVWERAQQNRCEISKDDSGIGKCTYKNYDLMGQVRAVDPEGCEWQWNCFF